MRTRTREQAHIVLTLKDIHRSFVQGGRTVEVLRGASMTASVGEVISIIGPSGAGKSTLLQIAGLLEPPTAGEVIINGTSCTDIPEAARTRLRLESLGFVYQFHHLLPEFSALENVVIPQIIAGRQNADARHRATDILTRLGLAERLTHTPSQLSGGEQQRVAISRAIVNKPLLLLADEPTGNLDQSTANDVFNELMFLARKNQLTALIATHNRDLAAAADRVLLLRNGVLTPE